MSNILKLSDIVPLDNSIPSRSVLFKGQKREGSYFSYATL